ncbi:glutamine amidotransferase [Litorihabitans aurantiacus]|uniref:Glutamine amidotransferase n=1 Tax=Litorihabitans aurantiacus TaxID=1930061 RepID=A0AA37XGQ7_9MICO|nr:glutamine amidotransferase [Litorihabitans aurantiacus]GMA32512.1 glutamine amidotransferase [Litorihabitans aurantiacus]
MREFVLLASRQQDAVADAEYAAFCRFMNVPPARLRRIRLDREPMPELDLDAVAGIVVGGSPFTSSDPEESKSEVQRRVEREIDALLVEICDRDLPFLGACYGVGTLGVHLGGVVDTTYGEPAGAVEVSLTPDGVADPLLRGLPPVFEAYVGHKEALRAAPPGSVLLASSPTAPVQMLRFGRNVYATQFHPELDAEGIASRLLAYRYEGYFDPAEVDEVLHRVRRAHVTHPGRILQRFAEIYG